MKTYGKNKELWNLFISKENFVQAQKKSRKGKTNKKEVIVFEKNLEENLEKIRQSVINGTFKTSAYRCKTIYEPKKRNIYIVPYAPDRIVQHAVMNVLSTYFEKLFIADSYACVLGKGQIKASKRTMQAVRKNKYCLKCDVHHFYPSINQEVLSKMIHKKFNDKKFLKVVDDIIFSFPGKTNCPIGNYTSQWFGNFYLTPLDLFCKHELKIKDYIRYCDDFLLFSNDKKYLHECRIKIEKFLQKELCLTYSKADVFNTKQGVDFCGYRHFNNYVLLRKSTAKRQQRKIKKLVLQYKNKQIDKDKLRSVLDSVLGWQKHARTYNLRKSMQIKEIREKYIC